MGSSLRTGVTTSEPTPTASWPRSSRTGWSTIKKPRTGRRASASCRSWWTTTSSTTVGGFLCTHWASPWGDCPSAHCLCHQGHGQVPFCGHPMGECSRRSWGWWAGWMGFHLLSLSVINWGDGNRCQTHQIQPSLPLSYRSCLWPAQCTLLPSAPCCVHVLCIMLPWKKNKPCSCALLQKHNTEAVSSQLSINTENWLFFHLSSQQFQMQPLVG